VTVRFHINKNADISKSISVEDAIYSTQAYASKKAKVWISDVLKQTFSDMQWFTSTKICRKLNWILQPTYTRLFKVKVSVVSEGIEEKRRTRRVRTENMWRGDKQYLNTI
jgi:hypothetical protein